MWEGINKIIIYSQNSDSKPYAFEVGKQVIKDHVKRTLDLDVEVTDGLTPGSYEIKYPIKNNPKVSIILDARKGTKQKIQKVLDELKNITYTNTEIILIEDEKNKEELKDFESRVNGVVIAKNNKFDSFNEAVKMAKRRLFYYSR